MLSDLRAAFPISLEQNCLLERVGETSVIIRVNEYKKEDIDAICLSLQERNAVVRSWLVCLEHRLPNWLVDYVMAYDSLLIEFDPSKIEFDGLRKYLKNLGGEVTQALANHLGVQGQTHEIEVCYQINDNSHPNDMPLVEAQTGLSSNKIIQLHQTPTYQVFAIGFMPNFAYLGELMPAISVPRLKEPRLKVPVGAVAIADTQTAVYPGESPGGWHIIGYTNFIFHDGSNSIIGPYDKVQFKSVELEAFLRRAKNLSNKNA